MSAQSGSRLVRLAGCVLLAASCRTAPVPPEVREAERLEGALGRAGASAFSPDSFKSFKSGLRDLREEIREESAKIGPFRNYDAAAEQARDLVRTGRDLLADLAARKENRARTFRERAAAARALALRLQDMTRYFNEDDVVRKVLAQSEIKANEAAIRAGRGEYPEADSRLREAEDLIGRAEEEILLLLARYRDPAQQAAWKAIADQTIAESKRWGTTVFIVGKLDRKLWIYKGGRRAAVYDIGLGKSGLSDKMIEGDDATPEGRYKIVRKYPQTPFYKALLINYPNDADLREFAQARRRGEVAAGARPGGAIEIHGGGKNRITLGCVGLENPDMDDVYREARIGAAVTIVGALEPENTILAELEKGRKT